MVAYGVRTFGIVVQRLQRRDRQTTASDWGGDIHLDSRSGAPRKFAGLDHHRPAAQCHAWTSLWKVERIFALVRVAESVVPAISRGAPPVWIRGLAAWDVTPEHSRSRRTGAAITRECFLSFRSARGGGLHQSPPLLHGTLTDARATLTTTQRDAAGRDSRRISARKLDETGAENYRSPTSTRRCSR